MIYNKNKSYTAHYTIIQASYWIAFLLLIAYATVYLLYIGYNELEIGIILAIANLIGVFIQPVIAKNIDKGKISIRAAILFILSIVVISSFLISFLDLPKFIHIFIFILEIISIFSVQSFIISLSILLTKEGYKVDYPISRGISSVLFAFSSVIIGGLIGKYSASIIPIGVLVFSLILYVSIIRFKISKDIKIVENNSTDLNEPFLKKYPRLSIFLFGMLLIFFSHNIFYSYTIKVVENIGGTEKEMGIAVAIGAFIEAPSIIWFSKIRKRISIHKLLILSAVLFTLKSIASYLLFDINGLYLAQLIQIFTFGLILPSSIYYIDEYVLDNHKSSAQAFLSSTMALSSVVAWLIGGYLINTYGITLTLLVAAIVSFIGSSMVIKHIIYYLRKTNK